MVVRWWLGLASVGSALLAGPAQAVVPVPRAACVTSAALAVFDARTPGARSVHVPIGPRNRITGGRVVGAQPTTFAPGTTRAALRARITARRVEWRLGARVARLARGGRRCMPAVPVSRPSVAGDPVVGGELVATPGRWRAAVGEIRYRWQSLTPSGWRGPIAAPSAVLRLGAAEAGATLRVLVTARGRRGWSAPAASSPLGPVRSPPTPEPAPQPGPPVLEPPLPRTVFSPSSFWNATIPPNVAYASDTVLVGTVPVPVNPTVGEELATAAQLAGARVNFRDYTVPLTVVPASTPLQPVRLCRSYPSGCVPSWGVTLDLTLRGIARDGTYLGGGVPVPPGFTPRTDEDAQAVFHQPDYVAPDGARGRLYELWGMRANPDFDPAEPVSPTNTRWMAAWGGRMVGVTGEGLGYWRDCWWRGCGYDADTNADPDAWGRPDSQAQEHSWGATATSLPLLGSEIGLDECRSGVIQHAVGVNVPDARLEPWWPAQRSDGTSATTTLIEGMRLTFPAGAHKPPGLTALGGSLWDAAKRYGLVLDDRSGSAISVRVEPGCEQTPWWGGIDSYAQLRGFPWAQLRVIKRGSPTDPNPTS
jgi:hypothetical protein